MAQKRMFSLQIVDTDRFLDMPTSAQCLYFHLGMHGDDEGFVASPRKIMSACGCNRDDLNILITKGFVYRFESGVCVIVDWRVNNTLKNDRFHPTLYTEEKAQGIALNLPCFQVGTKAEPQPNLTKGNLTKNIAPNALGKNGKSRAKLDEGHPTLEEVCAYCMARGNSVDAQRFFDFYSANGWVQGRGKPIRDWKAAVRTWERNNVNSAPTKNKAVTRSKAPQASYSTSDLVEYPPGSGNYVPADRVPKEAGHAV